MLPLFFSYGRMGDLADGSRHQEKTAGKKVNIPQNETPDGGAAG